MNQIFRTNVIRNQPGEEHVHGSSAEMSSQLTNLLNAAKPCMLVMLTEDVSTAVAPTQTEPSVSALKFMIKQALRDVRESMIEQLELENKKRNY